MKRKDYIKDVRSQDDAKLKEKLLSLSEEMMKLRFRRATGQLPQGHKIKEVKRQIAIIKTVISQKVAKAA